MLAGKSRNVKLCFGPKIMGVLEVVNFGDCHVTPLTETRRSSATCFQKSPMLPGAHNAQCAALEDQESCEVFCVKCLMQSKDGTTNFISKNKGKFQQLNCLLPEFLLRKLLHNLSVNTRGEHQRVFNFLKGWHKIVLFKIRKCLLLLNETGFVLSLHENFQVM